MELLYRGIDGLSCYSMTAMMRCRPTTCRLVAMLALALPLGCDTKVEQPDSGPNSSHRTQRIDPGSGSTLGKAKDRAKDVEGQVEDYNRRIEEAAEKVNER